METIKQLYSSYLDGTIDQAVAFLLLIMYNAPNEVLEQMLEQLIQEVENKTPSTPSKDEWEKINNFQAEF